MARIFNIYIRYDNVLYNAMVHVRKTPFFTEYTLTNIDDALIDILPSNKIISASPEHFVFHNSTTTNSELMQEIIRAVTEHLQKKEAQ